MSKLILKDEVKYFDCRSPSQEDNISLPNSMSSGSRIKTETSNDEGGIPHKSKIFNVMSNYQKGETSGNLDSM